MKIRHAILIIVLLTSASLFGQASLPLDTILKRSMNAAEKYNGLVDNYKAEVYMRTYVETIKKNFLYKYTHLVPRLVLHDPKSDEAVIETISTLKYSYPNNYTQNVKNVTGTLISKRDIEMIPFNLLNINVYGEATNTETFFMPIRLSTKKYYNYKLLKTTVEDNKTYYTIEFKPIYDNQKLLKGNFVIEYGTWRVVHFSAEGVESFADFSFEISMGETWISRFLPVKFVIYNNVSYLGNIVGSRHLASIKYEDVVLRTSQEKKKSLNISEYFKIKLDSVPTNNNTAFWDTHRAIPLQAKELDVINNYKKAQQEKLAEKLQKDSLQNGRKTQFFAQKFVLNSRYKIKSTMIGYSGLLNPLMLGYSTVDGITYRQKLSLNYFMTRSRSFNVKAFAGFYSKKREVVADVTSTWNYEPYHQGNISLSVGIGLPSYSSLFTKQVQEELENSGVVFDELPLKNYRDYYSKLYNDYEIFNGFVTTIGTEFHLRKPGRDKEELEEDLYFKSLNSPNLPDPPDDLLDKLLITKRSFSPFIRFSWTPEQYYRYEGRQKIYVRSKYPTFKIEFAKSIPDIFGSSSKYYRAELDISQNIQLGLMNSIQYHIGAGKFFNRGSEYFADFSFFAKNYSPSNWNDGIGGSFNLLNRQLYNASDMYIQGHIMIETPFLILRNIPIISEYINRERIYISQLHTPHIKSYTELGYGIGNRYFTRANAALFTSFQKLEFKYIGVKLAFEL